jgi:hypothetical protein
VGFFLLAVDLCMQALLDELALLGGGNNLGSILFISPVADL